jgi:hypothetical protein
MNLQNLLLNLDGLSDEEVEKLGSDTYKEVYITERTRGIIEAHDGDQVFFWSGRFSHAFYKATNWQTYNTQKNSIDRARVASMRWIKEFLSGNVPNSECWSIPNDGKPDKRLYASFAVGYVVWLEPREDDDGWTFSTAYHAPSSTIRGYVKQKGAKLLAKFQTKK